MRPPPGDDPPPDRPPPDDDPPPPPAEDPWSIDVDMSGLDRFVTGGAETWPVGGRATASEGLSGVEVNGAPATVMPDGSFTADVPVEPGLSLVPIVARDGATPAHARKAHRSLISASFQPEGALNPQAVAVGVTQTMVDAMAAPLATEIAGLDLAREILSRETLSADDTCTTWPTGARHGAPVLRLVIDEDGALWLNIRVPGLRIDFNGVCSILFGMSDVTGQIATDVEIWSQVSGPASDGCVMGLAHTEPYVELPGFDMSVTGSGAAGWLITLFSGGREADARAQMAVEFAAQADTMIGERLAGLSLFDRSETLTLFGQEVTVDLCLTELAPMGGTLRARLGARVRGTAGEGGHAAPGAPILPGALPDGGADSLWLDSQLIAQLVFSAWRAGGLDRDGLGGEEPIMVGILTALVPAIRGRFPAETPIDITTSAELPPVVRAAPVAEGATGDMVIEIGDMMIDLSAAGEPLFRLGATLRLTLELTPTADGALQPMVLDTEAEAHLLEEPIGDAPDEVLESVVADRIPETAGGLLDGAAIALPDVGGAITPMDVTADPGGRYLRIRLR
jgi:hypothetical protein